MTSEARRTNHVAPAAGVRRLPSGVLVAVATAVLVPLVAVLVLAATGQLDPPPGGLSDPGVLTRWGLPTAKGLHDAAATVTIGFLVLAAVVLPRDPADPDGLGPHQLTALRYAAIGATTWAAAGLLVVTLTYADVSAGGVAAVTEGTGFWSFVVGVELGRLLLGSAALVSVVAVGARFATQLSSLVLLTMLALGALLPLALTGHAADAADHDAVVNTQIAHLVGVTAWVGGLAGLGVLRGPLGDRLPAAARRFSAVAGLCFVLVAVSGVAGAAMRVGGWPDLSTAYGRLLVAKTVLLALLGVAGWRHRARTLTGLGRPGASGRAFARLATGELVVMATAVGLGVALSRTPPT